MEKRIDSIVFRRLTYADFRHINKRPGEEVGGGGQSYIDFPISKVSIANWMLFLGTNTSMGSGNRPRWDFQINSLGLAKKTNLRIYQRRDASVSIASQKIHGFRSNRVPVWHPDNSFPVNYNADIDNLVIYIVKTTDNEFWAGWILKNQIPFHWPVNDDLKKIFIQTTGYIKFSSLIYIKTEEMNWPFYFYKELYETKDERTKEEDLVKEDVSPNFGSLIESNANPVIKEKLYRIRKRNSKIVRNLKKLYAGCCQITNSDLTFQKKDGRLYSEVHHLIPLGEAGSDSYSNSIVVSPLIHRMLHYADVSEIDLSKINDNELDIFINGKKYTITWNAEHGRIVEESISD